MYSTERLTLSRKLTAWLLVLCLLVTLIPDIGFAANTAEKEKISPDEVTEKDVIDKSADTTTYDLGGGEKMTVFHGGAVRYELTARLQLWALSRSPNQVSVSRDRQIRSSHGKA